MMGPYATQILADYGADIIKVEPPEGDIMRLAGPMRSPNMGAMFLQANRNKRSIALDVKGRRPAGPAATVRGRRCVRHQYPAAGNAPSQARR